MSKRMSKRISKTNTKTNGNYKKAVKMLRQPSSSAFFFKKKISYSNYYILLNDDEEDFFKEEILEEKKEELGITGINILPIDTINIILEYLPYNTRLAILKHKYSKHYIKCMLNKIPQTVDGLTKLWKCADIAAQLLKIVLCDKSKIFGNFMPGSIAFFKEKKNPEIYSSYIKENFTKIILAAMKHYSRIYKEEILLIFKNINEFLGYYINYSGWRGNKRTVYKKNRTTEHIEQIMLHIFAHLNTMDMN